MRGAAGVFILILVSCLIAVPNRAGAADTQTVSMSGEELFLRNRPREAAEQFEQTLLSEPQNERLYEYLGICYQQLGSYEDAIRVMNRGLSVALTNRHLLYLNIGNNYFLQNRLQFAEEMYTNSIAESAAFAPSYLNRALVRIKLNKYADAVSDYRRFLSLEPTSPQRGAILEHIRVLEDLLSEEARKIEEQERLRREQEARERALLNEVLNSLRSASEDVRNLSAGSEDIQEYDDELTLDD